MAGTVFLVGAGPGDPDLLTMKAYRLLQQAETVVFDRLVSQAVLDLIPRGVTYIDVGKAPDSHTATQEKINGLLVQLARSGRDVVRLKGGDPYIFGRGGEEALHLADAGIQFEVVPGISAAQACSAYAGIPLTHRGLAHSVQFMTGHRCNRRTPDFDSASLANTEQTLVFYMGLENVSHIASALRSAGRVTNTDVAVVQCGSTSTQRTLVTTLSELVATVRRERVSPPALLIVGPTVHLAQSLAWFSPAPATDGAIELRRWRTEDREVLHA